MSDVFVTVKVNNEALERALSLREQVLGFYDIDPESPDFHDRSNALDALYKDYQESSLDVLRSIHRLSADGPRIK